MAVCLLCAGRGWRHVKGLSGSRVSGRVTCPDCQGRGWVADELVRANEPPARAATRPAARMTSPHSLPGGGIPGFHDRRWADGPPADWLGQQREYEVTVGGYGRA